LKTGKMQWMTELQNALERIRQAACRDIVRFSDDFVVASACESAPSTAGPQPVRQNPRQEPSAVVPLAGICAGGAEQSALLPWPRQDQIFPNGSKPNQKYDEKLMSNQLLVITVFLNVQKFGLKIPVSAVRFCPSAPSFQALTKQS
jgi:hypothetical protein